MEQYCSVFQSHAKGKSAKISREDVKNLFHTTLKDASTRLGVSRTTLKKICRKFGITRWPSQSTQISKSRRKKTSTQSLNNSASPVSDAKFSVYTDNEITFDPRMFPLPLDWSFLVDFIDPKELEGFPKPLNISEILAASE